MHSKRTKEGKEKKNLLMLMQKGYEVILEKTFIYPKTTIALGIVSVFIGIFIFSLLPQRLMPVAERDQFAVEIYLPKGNSIKNTAIVADSMEAILRKDKELICYFICGSSSAAPYGLCSQMPGENYAQFM